nr:MAG TPA: hypothetical protein [Caudoviricetes sp.]
MNIKINFYLILDGKICYFSYLVFFFTYFYKIYY